MATKTLTEAAIVGVFAQRSDAQRAVSALRQAGFGENEIGMVTQNREGAITTHDGDDNNAAEGAAVGAAAGVGVGALWALGIAAGMLPAIGPAIAGGLFASILTSAAGGAAVGGLVGALVGLGIPEDEAEFYESEVKAGRTIVTVKTDRRRPEAIDILQKHGASLRGTQTDGKGPHFATQNRFASSEATAYGRTDPHLKDTDACEIPSSAATSARRDQSTIHLKKEEVHPRKESHEAGEVRVRKDVVTEHKTFDVPVTKEEVVIERHPVSRKAGSGETVSPQGEIRVPLREEQVRVEKDTVVNEEVSIGKRAVTDTKHVAADAKREELHVEQKGKVVVKDAQKAKNPRP
jgi:uncharacterized protein (TIGR02271 family)